MASDIGGFHCTDCIYATFRFDESFGKWQGTCSRGYTLADPHVHTKPEKYFAKQAEQLVPVVDPYDNEYFRTKNTCASFEKGDSKAKEHGREKGRWHRHKRK